MENTITTTNTQDKATLLKNMKAAALAVDNAKLTTDSITAQAYLSALDALDKAIHEYNSATLVENFVTLSSLADAFKRGNYSAQYARYNKKTASTDLVGRATRLPISEFIAYAKEHEIELPTAAQYQAALKELTDALSAFVASELAYDGSSPKAVKISVPVEALKKVMDAVGMPDIYARPRDVRFLSYAVTGGASTIGTLSKIEKANVEKYLIDVYTVQIEKKAYDFENKKAEEKKA